MRLKLISLNIWNGGKLWDAALAFLKSENPDILALQEAQYTPDPFVTDPRYKTLDALSPKLNLPYRISAPMFNWINAETSTPVDMCTATLSRMTIIKSEAWFFSGQEYRHVGKEGEGDVSAYPHNLQYTLIQINEKKLHLLNVHGLWGTDGNDTPERLAMSAFILEKIGDKQPLILCGDFNTDATSRSIQNIGTKLHDVFGADNRITSFNMRRKPAESGYKTAVVDFIFTTPDITILSHRTPDVDVSDHLPLVLEFEI